MLTIFNIKRNKSKLNEPKVKLKCYTVCYVIEFNLFDQVYPVFDEKE